MSDYARAECKTHGAMRAAYVCQHINAPVEQTKGIGFNAVRDDQGCINAWCDTCEAYLVANGDEWNDVTEAFASIRLLCENCALERAEANGITEVT
jgi:hypothetical protein